MTRALLLAFLAAPALHAEQAQRTGNHEPLADNSFLVEEAYNQERGVVQHVAFFHLRRRGASWALGATQEWPAWSERHQVSYTVPLIQRGDGAALGDVAMHYRYQALAGDVALAPRLSVLLPTGSTGAGTTVGGAGLQVGLPASFRLSPWLSLHLNAGLGIVPAAVPPEGTPARLLSAVAGGSVIWFPHRRINFLAEFLVLGESWQQRAWGSGTLGSLGVRWGHDLSGGVQLVPGVGWAFGSGLERQAGGPLAYLSAEHRFR